MWPFGPRASALDRGLDAFSQRRWGAARRHLERAAAEYENAAGDYRLGLLYWRGLGGPRDPVAAVECFRRAAEASHPGAETALGVALRAGVGAARDEAGARALFRSAAGAGDVEAMTHLAEMCEPLEARSLLSRAAERGHAPAMLRLADFLFESDAVEALAWLYACVAATAEPLASRRAAALAQEMTADEIAAAQRAGRERARRLDRDRRGL